MPDLIDNLTPFPKDIYDARMKYRAAIVPGMPQPSMDMQHYASNVFVGADAKLNSNMYVTSGRARTQQFVPAVQPTFQFVPRTISPAVAQAAESMGMDYEKARDLSRLTSVFFANTPTGLPEYIGPLY